MNNSVNAMKIANEKNLYVKVVTGVKSFDYYNSFFNIYDESEEPCRRIVVLTKNKELEEVYDENPTEKIDVPKIVDDNLWLKDYELLVNPKNIPLDDINISSEIIEKFLNSIK